MMKEKDTQKKMRRLLWMMGKFKIPIIAYVRPRLLKITPTETQVKIKLRRRTKNHLNSMYFGALAVGADITAGLHAFYFAEQSNTKISFAFKAVKADFVKRATSDVIFNAQEGNKVKQVFTQALESKERINEWIIVKAINEQNEIVAVFKMEISVKVKN